MIQSLFCAQISTSVDRLLARYAFRETSTSIIDHFSLLVVSLSLLPFRDWLIIMWLFKVLNI